MSINELPTPFAIGEPAVVNGSAATGTLNVDLLVGDTFVYGTSTGSTGTFTLNFRGDAVTSLNVAVSTIPQIAMVTVINKTGAGTGSYPSVIQVDGTTVTPVWQGGTAPTGGNANSYDAYTFEFLKTAANTWIVFASQTKYA